MQTLSPEPHAEPPAPTHEPGLPPPENKRFYPALDGLRALAVVLVFTEHYLAPLYPAFRLGWTGVDIFFVLSGFLITGILYDTRDTPHRLRNFYMRRTLRIFPLYYGILFAALLTTPFLHWLWSPAWILWFTYLGNYNRFLFHNSPLLALGAIEHLHTRIHGRLGYTLYTGHFWSLAVEEQFYLLWPIIVFKLRDRTTLKTICLLSIPVVLAARVACLYLVPQPYLTAELLYRVTPLRIDALLIGGLLALALRGPEAARLQKLARPLFLLFLGTALVWLFVYFGFGYDPLRASDAAPFMSTVGFTFIDLFSAVVILNLLSPANPLARVFNLAPLRSLGRVSYGFYVFHDMFHPAYLHIVHAFFPSAGRPQELILVAAIGFPSTIALAFLSYRFFETPFLRLKSKFAN